MESQLTAGSLPVGMNDTVLAAIQDRTLVRLFQESLYPKIIFRAEALPELWQANLGTNQTFTRRGLIRPTTRALRTGEDPKPGQYRTEQWEATARQYGNSIDTHMPTSYVTLASLWLSNNHQLGLNAGMSINRVARDRLYNAYTAGSTVARSAVVASTALPVARLNGFTRRISAQTGRPVDVGPNNPLPIVVIVAGVPTARNVVGWSADVAGENIFGGTLTLDAAISCAARDPVLAQNRSEIVRSGGAASIDGVTSSDLYTLADVRAGVSKMRTNLVPVHEDGMYHLHLDPDSENQLFADNEVQRLSQSIPDTFYREFAIGMLVNTVFLRNTECPQRSTVDDDPEYGHSFAPELENALASPVQIHRPIMTGMGALEEKYLDESKYITDAGVQGRIAEFAVVNNGVQVMLERFRLIMRAPQDRLQQQVSSTWSWSGDFTCPTDQSSLTSAADYKRAVVFEHGA